MISQRIRLQSILVNQKSRLSYHHYSGNKVLGILREQHGMWERRSPLSPVQVKELLNKVPGSRVLIQPCTRRIFSNDEYLAAGAEVTDDLAAANMIIGVKGVNKEKLIPNKSYMFFSHTIKAQPYSMPLLDTILEKKVRLFDYECITREGRDDLPRLVAFGKYAGRAGMIDGLQGLGLRLLAEGFSTPFLHVPNTYMHPTLHDVTENLKMVGKMIQETGFPTSLSPIVFAFTGFGNVAQGSREIFEQLPHRYVTVDQLPTLADEIKSGRLPSNVLYAVNVEMKDMVKPNDPSEVFDKADYYRHPQKYTPIFHQKVLPYITMLVNGIYWEARFPRLITKDQIKELRKKGNRNLRCVADISCDIEGSVEFLSRPSTIEDPFYTYDPEKQDIKSNITPNGVLMLGVDNLPSELPRDASEHFGSRLLPLLEPLLTAQGKDANACYEALPPELKRACIASDGELLPKWQYIERLRKQAAVLTNHLAESMPTHLVNMELIGHLFDTGLINKVLDHLEHNHEIVNFSIVNCQVRPNHSGGAQHSRILLQLSSNDEKILNQVTDAITNMIEKHPLAEGSVERKASESCKVDTPKRVLLFGAGRVAVPLAKLFNQKGNVRLIIATEFEDQAKLLMNHMSGSDKSAFVPFRFPQDNEKLPDLIRQSDIVVSLLPATMHVPIAKEAIKQRRHLVTASYVSPEMRALHDQAVAEGVILLNEAGLDPGIDHMLIQKSIDDIHHRGGIVRELVSLCGGLPDPVAADNPLRYKFSWSPKGVMNASNNSAKYLSKGKLIEIPGEELLLNAKASTRFPTLRLEVLPNRDSLSYREFYHVPHVHSICRGTLRYEGWSNVMYAFKVLGLMSNEPNPGNKDMSLYEIFNAKFPNANIRKVYDVLRNKQVEVQPAMEALAWLGFFDEEPAADSLIKTCHGLTPVDAFCQILEQKLVYGSGEKDMVAMFHSIVGEMPDGSVETHTSRLLAFGTPGGDSAMSETVGYTAAAAAELVLDNKLAQTDLHGVVIPTDPRVYEPLLERLQQFGITWTENIHIEKNNK